jgi:hypothetical protein
MDTAMEEDIPCRSKALKDPAQYWCRKDLPELLEWQNGQQAKWRNVHYTYLLNMMVELKSAANRRERGSPTDISNLTGRKPSEWCGDVDDLQY